MDYNEYAANMDVGQAYLEVMSKVVQDGFTFVSTELDQWGVAAAEAQRQHQQQQQQDQAGGVKGKGKSNKGKSTGGASNTKKDKGASSKEGAAAPLQVTMAEKVRLKRHVYCLLFTNLLFTINTMPEPFHNSVNSLFFTFPSLSAEPPARSVCLRPGA